MMQDASNGQTIKNVLLSSFRKNKMPDLQDALLTSRVILEKLDPLAIVLFGSVAKSGTGSDLDFLVITQEQRSPAEIDEKLRDLRKSMAMDCLVVSTDMLTREFRRGSPFLKKVQKEGRLIYMKSALDEWVGLALDDLAQARYLYAGCFYRGTCYNAHQATEKGLKAELLRKGWDLERVHSIRRLLAIAEDFKISLSVEEADIDFLDSIYRGRYPAEEGLLPIGAPSKEDAFRALRIAAEILGQLKIFEGRSPLLGDES